MNHSIQKLKKISLLISILIFINILFGPLVRATDSGLACPDWPLCFGKVLPPPEFRIWMEVGHRYYSMILGFLILGQFLFIFKNLNLRKEFGFLAVLSILVLVLQVFLGKLTVTLLLNPATVNSHLLNAVFLFSIIITIHLKTKFGNSFVFKNILKSKFLGLILFSCFIQLIFGGRVSSNYAGLICADFPTCNSEYFPELKGLVAIQMIHRYMAYFIFLTILIYFTISIFKQYPKILRTFARMCLYVLGIQIILGISNVIYKLPVLVTALHTGMGVLLFILVYISWYLKNILEEKN